MKNGALKIALLYVAAGLAWIALSDRILYSFRRELHAPVILFISGVKGFFFIGVTAALLYKMIQAHTRSIEKDTTNRIAYEEQLLKKNRENSLLGEIIDKINNMVVVTDVEERVLYVNKSFETFTGYLQSEMLGELPIEFLSGEHPDEYLIAGLHSRFKAQDTFALEIPVFNKENRQYWAFAEFTPLYDDQRAHTGYIIILTDISTIKEKEESLLRRNNTLKEIAWLESHEMRRPLASILGLVNLIRDTPSPGEKDELFVHLSECTNELDRMVRMISKRIHEETLDT